MPTSAREDPDRSNDTALLTNGSMPAASFSAASMPDMWSPVNICSMALRIPIIQGWYCMSGVVIVRIGG